MRRYSSSIFCILFALTSIALGCPKAIGSQETNNTMPVVAPLRDNLGNKSIDPAPTAPSSGSDNKSTTNTVSPTNGQSDNTATGVSSAPGADAMMTRDLLLVSPNKGGQPPKPLQDFVGNSLTLTLGRSDIILDGLRGIMITVTNDTSRPLFIDGHSATATAGGHSYSAAPVAVVQKSVLPNNSAVAKVYRLLLDTSLGGFTVGAVPTVKDYITIRKPISKRYGPDERRRIVEASRFGKRILWPHQKTEGIMYFKTHDSFAGVKLQMPINTLFDKTDSAILGNL